MQTDGGRIWFPEKLFFILAIPAVYFLSLPRSVRAVFMGAFNNLDGSLFAARAASAAAGTAIFIAVAFQFFPSRLDLRRLLFFFAATLGVVGIGSLVEMGLGLAIKWLFNLPFGPDAFSDKQLAFPDHDTLRSAVVLRNALAAGCGLVYGIGRDWVIKSRTARRLESEKMKADIALLRSQVNPHYFFNALNNIYAIAQRHDDEETGRAILKLSETMRYVIYDSDADAVRLNGEVEYIRNTIDVFRLRFGPDENPDIRLRTDGDLNTALVPPMILTPFVENALKHGLDSRGRGRVDIEIRREGPWLDMRVENTRPKATDPAHKAPGVGLANVRKRLELLYPGRHELAVEDSPEVYRVHLRMQCLETNHDPMSRHR
jgi:hypothetical protein